MSATKGRLHPVVQVVAALVVIVAGLACSALAFERGHTLLVFLSLAVMLGALVPLYPPDDPPDGMIR